jgi:broad specificity phosphatase PhoE
MIYKLLQQSSEEDKISLLIRHSDRYDIPNGSEGRDVPLNKNGKLNAMKFGEKISAYKLNKIITTPLDRCRQTAECIAKGYGQAIEIEPSNTFGGLHLSDWKKANEFLSKEGYPEWYKRIINDVSVEGIQSAVQYNKLMTGFLTENTTENGLTIFVSHDFLIAYYHYSLDKTIYSWDNWVKYLSGLILKDGKYVAGFQNN